MAYKLTETQLEQIVELREKGWSTVRIGRKFGVSAGAVNYQCMKAGAFSPRQQPTQSTPESTTIARRRDTFRTFSKEEDQRLIALEAEGIGYSEMAKRMGRARTSCRMRLMRLALSEEIVANG